MRYSELNQKVRFGKCLSKILNESLMKTQCYLLLFNLLFVISAHANHFAGADFHYRYIGDSTNIPNHYEITYSLLRDVAGLPAPQNINITAQSSCYANQSVSLSRDLSIPITTLMNLGNCVLTAVPVMVLEKYDYKGTIILSGTCQDWTFSTGTCCWQNTENFVGAPIFFSQIRLNNTLGPNSSPAFDSFPLLSACSGQRLKWSQWAVETEPDSVRFVLAAPMSALNTSVNYQPVYSATRPFNTTTPSPLLDGSSGMLEFLVGNRQGAFGFSVDVENWRLNPATNDWILVGTSNRTSQLLVVPSCAQTVVMGPQFDFSRFPNNTTGARKIQGFCGDTTLNVHFQGDVDCASISLDGSEFRLESPAGLPIPVIGAVGNCNPPYQTTQELVLQLGQPLNENGAYALTIKVGNDGDLFVNDCGFAMQAQAPIAVEVDNCPPTTFNLAEHSNTSLQWGAPMPNPSKGWFGLAYQNGSADFVTVEVNNAAGQTFFKTEQLLSEPSGRLEFSTTHWPAGIFVMTIQTTHAVWQKKILVQ